MEIQEFAGKSVSIFGPLMIFSVFGMWSWLMRKGYWDFWEHFFMWPKMVIDYRKYTREQLGRPGVLSYVFFASLIGTILSSIILFVVMVTDQSI